jgi:uncharacterized protein YprB with RNaseH-like and TPR domain
MDIVFDIETAGVDFEMLSESQREFILRYAEKEKDEEIRNEKIADAKRYLSLYPFTASVVAIGLLRTDTASSLVLYESAGREEWENKEKSIKYMGVTETEMLNLFWDYAAKAERVITFNGRQFDVPFLILRSAMKGIKPTRKLLGGKYSTKTHIDLLEEFTFHGLVRKFNLDFYCRAFGIDSPKGHGITGMDVRELYKAGRIKDIAIYCGDDVRATFELFKIWDNYLNIN